MTFAKWLDQVDDLCRSDVDMLIHDLPASTLHNAYEYGLSATEFINRHGFQPKMSRSYRPTEFATGQSTHTDFLFGELTRALVPGAAHDSIAGMNAPQPLF